MEIKQEAQCDSNQSVSMVNNQRTFNSPDIGYNSGYTS